MTPEVAPRLRRLLRLARLDAESVAARNARLAFVACAYDTAFEPVGEQVAAKCQEIADIFPPDSVGWTLWVVDDDLDQPGFREAVTSAAVPQGCRVRVLPLPDATPGGQKGRAILAGFAAALAQQSDLDALIYVNLNLKVDARLAATGVRQVLDGADAAIGTRARRAGGAAYGAGGMGRFKSVVFNTIVRRCLPKLSEWQDTNAPMKVFSPRSARLLHENAVIPRVTMDVEWLTLLSRFHCRTESFPVVWTQRPGSRPPWRLAVRSAADVLLVRQLWG